MLLGFSRDHYYQKRNFGLGMLILKEVMQRVVFSLDFWTLSYSASLQQIFLLFLITWRVLCSNLIRPHLEKLFMLTLKYLSPGLLNAMSYSCVCYKSFHY